MAFKDIKCHYSASIGIRNGEGKIMKKAFATMALAILAVLISAGSASDSAEIRGQVTNLGVPEFVYDASNFPGFYYDLNSNVGAEKIDFLFTNSDGANAVLSDQPDANNNRGIVYTTVAQVKNFRFKPWGSYNIIGFMGDGYLASYSNQVTSNMKSAGQTGAPFLYSNSKETNLMRKGLLSKVLIDDNAEMTITSRMPLVLAEGYQLNLKSISLDGNEAFVELSKDGSAVDSKVVRPSINDATIGDKTYYYKTDIGDTKGIIAIAVHFKNCFHAADENLSTIDGIFQISYKPAQIKQDQQFGKLSIRDIDANAMTITMDNKDNAISLSKDTDTELMKDIYIKSADQSVVNADAPLRYYIYKKLIDPGKYEIRGAVANSGMDAFTLDPRTFAGFYYDLDKNIGTENITFTLTESDNPSNKILMDTPDENGNRGVVYATASQPKNFKFKPWGQYNIIGFLGVACFTAYSSAQTQEMQNYGIAVPYLYDVSKNRNLMLKEELSRVLIDDNQEQVIKKGSSLPLKEGYELALKGIDDKGHLYVELLKNDKTIDTKLVQPSVDGATMADKTYYYRANLGDVKEIATIAVHFKNSYRDEEQAFATVDGVWQISDMPLSIKAGKQFDKMSIQNVDPMAMTIKMDNKDNRIALSKNKNSILMQNISLRTADQDIIDEANPLRYYIYIPVTVESGAAQETASSSGPAIPENKENAINQKPESRTVNEGI